MRKDVKIGLVLGLVVLIAAAVLLIGRPDEPPPKPAVEAPVTAEAPAVEAGTPVASADRDPFPSVRPGPESTAPGPATPATPTTQAAEPLVSEPGSAPVTVLPPPAPLPPAPASTPPFVTTMLDPAGSTPPDRPAPAAPRAEPPPAPVLQLPTSHVVRQGETLYALAMRYYNRGTWRPILAANPQLKGDARRLRPGMKLVIPDVARAPVGTATPVAGKPYRVQPADTLRDIAQRVYNDRTRFVDIYEANVAVLKSPDHIRVGMVLEIPKLARAPSGSVLR